MMRITLVHQLRHHLGVMHAGVRHFVVGDDFAYLVDLHMILIPEAAGLSLLRPASISILLALLGLRLVRRFLAATDLIVLVTTVLLARNLDKGGVDDAPVVCDDALLINVCSEATKEPLDHLVFCQLQMEGSDSLLVGYVAMEPKS